MTRIKQNLQFDENVRMKTLYLIMYAKLKIQILKENHGNTNFERDINTLLICYTACQTKLYQLIPPLELHFG